MRLTPGMQQRQQLQQKLSPRMIQAMQILQLPQQALEERIEQALVDNPALEMQEADPNLPTEPNDRENPDAPTAEEKELVVDAGQDNGEDFERLLDLTAQAPDYFDESPRQSSNRMQEDADRRHDAIANIASRPETLQDYLISQLHELEVDPELLPLCERIISTLDPTDGGYFRGNLEDILPANANGPEHVEKAGRALALIQSLEPRGVAARDLRECLLMQLDPEMPYYEEMRALISSHLENLRDNRLPRIQRDTGYSLQQIQAGWDHLRRLNPKPAREFAHSFVPSVTPDIIVKREDDGTYRVQVDDYRTPRLHISEYYLRRLRNGTATEEEKEFIKHKINAAQWLIESIEQRRSTVTRVAQAVVDHQTSFLDYGPEYIEPLKMQQIADKVGVHVTTVSRAVDDKWIETPRGVFPLKRFFVGGTHGADGEDVAWDVIRIKLQEVVDAEDKANPYSDEDLVKQLAIQGVIVARRTITKYRKKMGIGSSRQRRVWSE
ncbi:MAG: RNA polymerase factor sigma-54 [Planctomycetales bacterium]|nr:RNA polymerase factor sigma-54 [Planctomycetales bacterium]